MTDYRNLAKQALSGLRSVQASFEATNYLENILVSEQEEASSFVPDMDANIEEVASVFMNLLNKMQLTANERIMVAAWLHATVTYRAVDPEVENWFCDSRDDVAAMMLVSGQVARDILRDAISEDDTESVEPEEFISDMEDDPRLTDGYEPDINELDDGDLLIDQDEPYAHELEDNLDDVDLGDVDEPTEDKVDLGKLPPVEDEEDDKNSGNKTSH